MYTKITHRERREFLDRLEKKYIKKIQLRAFHQESEQVKRSLLALRGRDTKDLRLRYL
jgi:hypothetical protein